MTGLLTVAGAVVSDCEIAVCRQPVEPPLPPQHSLAVGCRLEAVHPNRTAVCPATVVALLDSYFFRVQIDGSDVCFTSSLQDSSILPHGEGAGGPKRCLVARE